MTARIANTSIGTGITKSGRARWWIPTGLILLSLIPLVAGAARVTEVTGGAVSTIHNARFLASPIPVSVHVVSVTVYSLLGAFQFVTVLRRRGWHRSAGWILIPAGLLTALSGMWMAGFYPRPPGDGAALAVLRLMVGSAMVSFIGLGVRAIVRGDFARHGQWMTRAYAVGMGAGTQAILLVPGAIVFGPAHELSRTILMGAAWVINLAIAELFIRGRGHPQVLRTAI